MVGELGWFKGCRTIHEDLMATVDFPTHGPLEVLMDSNVIGPTRGAFATASFQISFIIKHNTLQA